MANLSPTAANVKWVGGVRPRTVTGGATGTRGQGVYKDTADNEHKLTDADVLATAELVGILLTDMTDGSDCLIAVDGSQINVGATTVAGVLYVCSVTPGLFCPVADLASGDFPCAAFWGSGTAVVTLNIVPAGVAI
jgi:hypothetical protein